MFQSRDTTSPTIRPFVKAAGRKGPYDIRETGDGHMLVGNLELRGRVMLAPMSGYNDPAFRRMCRRYGSCLMFTDMVSAAAVSLGNPTSLALARPVPGEDPLAIQLYGFDPDVMARAVERLERECPGAPPAMYDLNLGCPVKKIVSKGGGSALLDDPAMVGRLVEAMRSGGGRPVSVKMRLGREEGDEAYRKVIPALVEAGADMLVVHGRYASQMYSGRADRGSIREACRMAAGAAAGRGGGAVPVVCNGDVTDGPSAAGMLAETGCDAVMVGRAAAGDPHIFKRISAYLETGDEGPPPDRVALFREYYELAMEHGMRAALIKKQAMKFCRGMPDSRRLRDAIKMETEAGSILGIFTGKGGDGQLQRFSDGKRYNPLK